MLSNAGNHIARMFQYGQRKPRAQKPSPHSRLLAARDTAFAMMLVLSQTPVDQKIDLDTQDSLSIVRDCIIPRIQKMFARVEGDRQLGPRGNLPWPSDSMSEGKCEGQIAHIELMVYLVKNRGSFGPKFWCSIARWQIETYRRCKVYCCLLPAPATTNIADKILLVSSPQVCEKLLIEYKEATCDMSDDRGGVEAFSRALEKAVKRAHALPDPDQEKARLSDVFSIRNTYDDPDVKALIESDRFTPGKRIELQNAVQDLLLRQPLFPLECYVIQRA